MFIHVDAESNKRALKQYLTAFIFLIILFCPFAIYLVSCTPKSEIEQHLATPPSLYESETNSLINSNQQWQIPAVQISDDNFSFDESNPALEQMTAGAFWSSPAISLQNQTDQLYVYIDFAGQQQTRKDLEIAVLPICILDNNESPCMKAGLHAEGQIFHISTKEKTEYHTLNTNKSWIFYGHHFQENYIIPPNATLKFIVKGNIPEHLSIQWLRLTFSTNPIVEQQQSFMLNEQGSVKFKYLLALLPLFIFALIHVYQGFESLRNLTIGGLAALLFAINTIIWDIQYMVIGCLILCFASVCYCFENRYYRLLYLSGYLIIGLSMYFLESNEA